MFRKNLFYSAIIAMTMTLCQGAYAFHRYTHDCWRDAAAETTANLYLGIQGAYINSNWCDLEPVFQAAEIPAGLTEARYAGRVFAQLDYTKYFGVQLGCAYIDRAEYNLNPPMAIKPLNEIISMTIVDLCLTTRLPMQNGFWFYSKVGAQYNMVKNGLSIKTDVNPATVSGSDQTNLSFTFGIGLLYPFTSNVIADLSWQYFSGSDDIHCFVADVNMFMIGLSYRFAI